MVVLVNDEVSQRAIIRITPASYRVSCLAPDFTSPCGLQNPVRRPTGEYGMGVVRLDWIMLEFGVATRINFK